MSTSLPALLVVRRCDFVLPQLPVIGKIVNDIQLNNYSSGLAYGRGTFGAGENFLGTRVEPMSRSTRMRHETILLAAADAGTTVEFDFGRVHDIRCTVLPTVGEVTVAIPGRSSDDLIGLVRDQSTTERFLDIQPEGTWQFALDAAFDANIYLTVSHEELI